MFDVLLQSLENKRFGKAHVVTALLGTIATVGMWMTHARYPKLFGYILMEKGELGAILLFVGLVPPFLAAYSIGQLFWPTGAGGKASGAPMSAYLEQEQSRRRWRLLAASAMIGAANFLCLLMTCY